MKLDKQRKIMLGVLGLAVLALLVDQVFLAEGSPAPAAATAGEPPRAPADPSSSETEARKQGTRLAPGEGPSIADRLAAAAKGTEVDPLSIRDAFRPGAAWTAQRQPTSKPAETKKRERAAALANAFRAGHKLLAVMMGPQGGTAIVDGKCVRVGQEIDGFALVAVENNAAVFAREGVSVELRLSRPGQLEGPP